MGTRRARLTATVLAPLALSIAALAQTTPPTAPCPAAFARVELTGGVDLCAATIRQVDRDTFEADGSVTISLREEDARLQADRIVVSGRKTAVAEGNVLVVWGPNRLTGTRMTYDLESGDGTIENATGQVEPEFYFTAAEARKLGEDRVHLRDAVVTTCTQPVPYWSFKVSRAKIRMDHYAHLTNIRLHVNRVPAFWLPYLVWPVKRDRAAGLLFPSFGTTRDRGDVISQGFFIPLGPSADVLLFGEYYTRAGWGGGALVRAVPSRDGSIAMRGFVIDDLIYGGVRYNVSYQQTQRFENGFRLIADVNQVSDFDFYNDYERELNLVSSPTILARVEMTRNGPWGGLNVRELRREQLFSDGRTLVQQTLPELEWRGRSTRLGRSPFYLSSVASFANIQQTSRLPSGDVFWDADYLRADVFPTISAPLSPRPWLDVTPSIGVRGTAWTQSRDPQTGPLGRVRVRDEGLTRFVGGGSLEIVGPKAFRIFERTDEHGTSRFKHTIEPRVRYLYQQPYDRSNEVIVYDEVDASIQLVENVTYGIRSRLFAQRPRAAPPAPAPGGERILVSEGEGDRLREARSESDDAAPQAAPPATEPLEIASFELNQVRSLDRSLSQADLDGDGSVDRTSSRSDVEAAGRFNPSNTVSLDARARYNILFDRISDVSLSGFVRRDVVRTGFSLVHRNALAPGAADSTQIRLLTGVTLWGGRVRLDFDGSFVPTAEGTASRVPDQRWRLEYYLQCCGFLAEYYARDFVTTQRRDFRFTIDLRGIGKLLDFKGGYEE